MGATHAADVDLARRCAAGEPAAWDEFVLQYRPVLYRAADALDPHGGAREVADALYAELYGMKEGAGERQSLFRYFHGRSSLAAWLRAVLAQRYVDRLRAGRRLQPLADVENPATSTADTQHRRSDASEPDVERPRYVVLLHRALSRAVGRLAHKDRLRLGCYYVQELTLAQIGRLLGEHEATVSRQLARTRTAIRKEVERELRDESGLTDVQIAECLASVTGDPGPLDLTPLLGSRQPRDEARERSL